MIVVIIVKTSFYQWYTSDCSDNSNFPTAVNKSTNTDALQVLLSAVPLHTAGHGNST